MHNVTLIGMPGAGKSTAGVLLAKALGYGFVDTDLLIQKQEGQLLQTILNTRGSKAFLDIEEAVISGLDCRQTVIAPGGSAVCRAGAIERLKQLGPVVYLYLSCPTIEARLSNIHTRGVVLEPGQTIAQLYQCRAPLFARYADLTVEADGQTPEETVAAILEALGNFEMKKGL